MLSAIISEIFMSTLVKILRFRSRSKNRDLHPAYSCKWECPYYVLGTQPQQNVLGTCSWYTSVHITSTVKCSRYPFDQVENGTHLGLRSMTYCVYTAQRVRSFWCALSVLIAVCVLSPAHLEHCSRYTSVHTCFGCVLRGRFVPRTWFDHVPAGTVLAGTILFSTPFRLQKMVCTENMFREHVPAGTVPRTSMNARLKTLLNCLQWKCFHF